MSDPSYELALAHSREGHARATVRKLESHAKRLEGERTLIGPLILEAKKALRRRDWARLATVARRVAYLADGHKAVKALPNAKQELAAARVALNAARALDNRRRSRA